MLDFVGHTDRAASRDPAALIAANEDAVLCTERAEFEVEGFGSIRLYDLAREYPHAC